VLALLRLAACPSRGPGQLHAVMREAKNFERAVLSDTVEQEMPWVPDAILGSEHPDRVPKVQRPDPGHAPYRL